MHTTLKALLGVAGVVLVTQAAAQVTFYESENFHGRSFTASDTVWNFEPTGFNDRASSAVVDSGNWQVCEDARFEGRCVVLRPGSYPSLRPIGMYRVISSVRPVNWDASYENAASAPVAAAPDYEYRQRPNEQLFEAQVTSVRAVMGPPEQRCWVEREQVVQDRGPNVGGAILGGILGGVLGHQIGGGVGRDVATAGGAVAGAALGSNVGRGSSVSEQDVRHCENVQGQTPAFWDVTYNFQGIQHRAQLSAPPGQTITVNGNGDPRG